MTILLVRHAVALARRHWDGDDDLRPLTKRGRKQADRLVAALRDWPVDAVFTSPALRCRETVAPLAAASGLAPEPVKALAEGRGTAALPLVDRAEHVVLCAHGDNLPELLLALAGHLDDVPPDPPFAKGATWALRRKDGKVRHATYLPPPA